MIPYSLIRTQIHFDTEMLSVSLEEISPSFIRFYTPKEDLLPDIVQCTFYIYLPLSQLSVKLQDVVGSVQKECDEKYRTRWQIKFTDSSLSQAANTFCQEYMEYIQEKTTLCEEDVAYSLTKLPEDSSFSYSLDHWQKKHLSTLRCDSDWMRVASSILDIAIFLHDTKQIDRFLTQPFQQFLSTFWSTCQMQGHDCSGLKINRIYFGSHTCVFLLPPVSTVQKLLEKSICEDLSLSLALPPIALGQETFFTEYLTALSKTLLESNLELIINELGCAELCRRVCASFPLRLGPLLNRSLKDPRIKYLDFAYPTEQTLLQKSYYIKYLEDSYSISTFSGDVSSPHTIPLGPTALSLPFYLTNLSTRCTLQAVIDRRERGCQKEIISCSYPCFSAAFFYPDSLSMLGVGNALYALNTSVLQDSQILSSYISDNIDRLVFDFLEEGSPC